MLLGRDVEIKVYEDKERIILIIKNGYPPALRHLVKPQKCSIDLVHNIIHELNVAKVDKVHTGAQIADIFTKSLQPKTLRSCTAPAQGGAQ